jgi:hypothetical protein
VGFVVEKVALGQIFLCDLQFYHQYNFTLALHTHISPWGQTAGLLATTVQTYSSPHQYEQQEPNPKLGKSN